MTMNKQLQTPLHDLIEWLKMLVALVAAVLLVVVYVLVPVDEQTPRWLQLIIATIPSALVVLIAIPVVYILLYRRGLTFKQQITDLVGEALNQPMAA